MTGELPRQLPDVDAVPPGISFQVFGGCNLRCVMCSVRPSHHRRPGPMPMEIFRSALDELSAVSELEDVCLSLQCEPTLDPFLGERIRYVKSLPGSPVTAISTNAVCLFPDRLTELLDAGLDRLNVSFNAYTAESFTSVCGYDGYGQVVANISHLLEMWGERPGLSITSMVCRTNMREVLSVEPEVLRRARDMGIPVGVSPISNHCGWLHDYDDLVVLSELQSSTGKTWCGDIFEAFYILVDGRVIGCCGDSGAGAVFGRVPADSLLELWHGSEMRERRRQILASKYDSLTPCRICSQAHNIMRRRRSTEEQM